MRDYSDVTVIIPTLNEEKNIAELVRIIKRICRGAYIIVSDDSSSDGTREAAIRAGASVIDRTGRAKGLTASVIDAVKESRSEYIIVIDGDLQHPPEKIGELASCLRSADIAIGTRTKVIGKWPLHRKIMSQLATILARIRLGKNIKDPMSGFFAIRSGLIKSVLETQEGKFEKTGYKILFDILKNAPSAKTKNVPYVFGERKLGKSKIGTKQILSFIKSLAK